jgi:hypothetical protein
VCEIVPNQLERVLFVPRGDQLELGIPFERPVEVAQFAVDLGRQRRLGQPRPDRRRDIRGGRALGHFPNRTVRERDLEHPRHCDAALAAGAVVLNHSLRTNLATPAS